MASNLKYAVALKNARLDEVTSAIGASGLMRIYSGTQPTNPDTALSGNTLLAELALSATFAAAASGGVLTASAITADSSADASGTPTWGTLCTSGAVRKVDFSVGTTGCDLNLTAATIAAGSQVSVSSATITASN
jgi:hypothetical protein